MDYVRGRLRSICYAINGIRLLVQTQPNARIHGIATLLVTSAGWYLGVSRLDWIILIAAIGGVWTAEALNTAIEWVLDLCSPGYHPLAGKAKDTAAAAVLLASFAAIAIGLLVFYPYVESKMTP